MHPEDLIALQKQLSTLGSILELLLLIRIAYLGLAKHYRYFVVFLVCDLTRDVLLESLSRGYTTSWYAVLWGASAPMLWATLTIAVFDASNRFYKSFPVPAEIRHMLLGAGVLAGMIVSIGLSTWLVDARSQVGNWVDIVRVGNRFVFVTAAMVLWAQRCFFTLARPRLPRNTSVHRNAFLVYLTAEASLRFLSGLHGPVIAMTANLICTVTFCLALVWWMFGLRSNGDRAPEQPFLSSEEMARREREYQEHVRAFLEDFEAAEAYPNVCRRVAAAIGKRMRMPWRSAAI